MDLMHLHNLAGYLCREHVGSMGADFKLGVTLGFIFSLQVIYYVFRLRFIEENAKNAEDLSTGSKLASLCVGRAKSASQRKTKYTNQD